MIWIATLAASCAVIASVGFAYLAHRAGRRIMDQECIQLRVTVSELLKRLGRKRKLLDRAQGIATQLGASEMSDEARAILIDLVTTLDMAVQRLKDEEALERQEHETNKFFQLSRRPLD